MLSLTKAISPSPAQVSTELVEALRANNIPPAEIVEVVSLVATLQLLHRLMAFYPPPYDSSKLIGGRVASLDRRLFS